MTSFILVNPQIGENIGAAARALANFEHVDLRLVAPRDGWPNKRAIGMASGAFGLITPTVYDTLRDALSDCHYAFATTARKRDCVKPVFTPESACCQGLNCAEQKTAFVFGAERTGLSAEDISLCQAIISIPVNPQFASLNLAQSVLLVAYEWHKQNLGLPADQKIIEYDSARQEDVESFLQRLEAELDDKHFFRDEALKPTVARHIRDIFTRAELTDQELRTLHGVVSALRGNKKKP